MLNKIDKELAFVQSALDLRARRQEILASNLANSDTPNYKAQDLDFASALRSAMGVNGGQGASLNLQRTNSRHLDGAGAGSNASASIKFRSTVQPSLDGNTVDVNVERAQFTDNAIHYQFLLDRASGAFSTLKLAVGSDR